MKKINTIDTYIKSFPPAVAEKLRLFRKTVQKAAPRAEETISYQMPTFKLNGNLVHFAAFKNHIGFYPAPSAIRVFKKELSPYKTSKGAIQFSHEKPLPLALISKIVKYRVKQNEAKQKKRPSSKALGKSPSSLNHIIYHRDGSIWAKGKIVKGLYHGYWQWFRKDGTILRSGHFLDGQQVGEWITYNKSGKVYKITSLKKSK